MNRSLSFSISFVAHMTCVGLLFLTSKPGREKPTIMEACRVTLFSAVVSPPSSPRGKPEVVSPAPPVPRRADPKPTPVLVTREVPVPKPRPREDRSYDFRPLAKLEEEALPQHPLTTVREVAGPGSLSVSAEGGSSFDAYIAQIIKSNWIRPSRAVVGENPPSVSVAIRIALDGKITERRITRGSGIGLLDASAVKAIERSNPFPIGLPSYMGRRYYDVTIVFHITDEV